ncbi:MAG: preprotein translocase subunit YajC [Propioniciclava sp.]|uniref:preprotein translocase subunit YajC n=1 Tax=Propioniciclava sp. TaxID=2038686 RepID=UPI0039E58101
MPADNSMLSTLLMLAVMGLAFYFLLIRPSQKKQKAQQTMVSQLAPGSRIMTTAGVLATIRHMGERQAIIEIAPGVEMTVLKQAIMRTVNAEEEEFEYDDDTAAETVGEFDLDPDFFAQGNSEERGETPGENRAN